MARMRSFPIAQLSSLSHLAAHAFGLCFAPLFGARVCVRGGPRGSRKPPCPAVSWILLCASWRKVLRRFSMGALVYVESPQLTYTALSANVLDPVGPQRGSCYVLSLVMSAVTCGPCLSPFDCCSLFVIRLQLVTRGPRDLSVVRKLFLNCLRFAVSCQS